MGKGEKQSATKDEAARRFVLVGTYKKGQLAKWRGWYNYPVSEKELSLAETRSRGEGGAQSLATDYAKVNELWLFNGTKDQKTYAAEFVGVKTREELIRDYGYPVGKGKAHGDKYLLFKTAFKYRHKLDNPLDCERVIIRLKDFARSPKVAKQLREYLASPDRRDPTLANMLPTIVTKLPPKLLRVCEAAMQLDFFQWSPVVGSSPLLDKIESIVMSIGEFGRVHALSSSDAYMYLKRYKGLEYLDNYHAPLSCLPIESLVDDLARVCRNNGGALR